MVQFGSGFNRWYLDTYSGDRLQIPEFVSHIELGLCEYKNWLSKNRKFNGALSLHLARTPVTEDKNTQRAFIDYLFDNLYFTKSNRPKISSIGLHLIGSRYQGIGRFGFSTHFDGTKDNFIRASHFISMLIEKFQVPIWIENANFYSASSAEIFQTWEVISRILEKTQAGLILDISHLFIDAVNNNLSPTMVLGAVPQKFISEIHLSGIFRSKDNTYHDGHSCAIPNQIWNLFSQFLANLANSTKQIVYTIEHTSPIWITKKTEFRNDFNKLHHMVINRKIPSSSLSNRHSEQYAKNYLKKLLKSKCNLDIIDLKKNNIDFDLVFDAWLETVLKDGKRVVLTKEEVPPAEWKYVHFAEKSFSKFTKIKIHENRG